MYIYILIYAYIHVWSICIHGYMCIHTFTYAYSFMYNCVHLFVYIYVYILSSGGMAGGPPLGHICLSPFWYICYIDMNIDLDGKINVWLECYVRGRLWVVTGAQQLNVLSVCVSLLFVRVSRWCRCCGESCVKVGVFLRHGYMDSVFLQQCGA